MNEFITECRREWKRLRVPDPVADEMGADLLADLEEAEADGVSPEEVLGSDASDPRAFARSWAVERGVVPPRSRKPLALAGTAALTITAAVGAALVIFASPDASAPTAIDVPREVAASRAAAAIATIRVPPPPIFAGSRAPLTVWVKADGRGVVLAQANSSGVDIHRVGSILLIVGIAGLILSMPLLFWSSRRFGAARP